MNLNVANCPNCGRVFQKGLHNYCGACVKEIEDQFERCYQYLRENRSSTMNQLSEETEVSIKQITKFIKDGRIFISDLPNMGYPCESCGEHVRSGKLCLSCSDRITKGIQQVNQTDQNRIKDEADRTKHASFKFREGR